jgi:hypothetical protein
MKTTLESPDAVIRRAAERGIPLRQFVTEAVADTLQAEVAIRSKLWMEGFGGLRHLRKETARINKVIEEEFEQIEPG